MTGNVRHRRPNDQERAFFEAIVVMRGRYATRDIDDATPVMGLHHVIASVNAAMRDANASPAPRLGSARN